MKTKNCITSTKKSVKLDDKYDHFVSIVLLHDQPVNRMKSYMPLALLQLDDKNTLLDLQIKAIEKKFSNYEIIVTSGQNTEKVVKHIKQRHKNKHIRVIENVNFNETSNAESARLSLNNVNNDKVFFIDGHLFFTERIFDNFMENESYALCNKEKDESLDIGLNIGEAHSVQYFCYGATFVWSEVLFLTGVSIFELEKALSNKQFKNKFLFEAVNEVLKKCHIKTKYIDTNNIIKIKNNKTYQRARSKYEVHN